MSAEALIRSKINPKTNLKKKDKTQDKSQCPPKHVALILDGNGRWAKRKNMPRFQGHRAGANKLNQFLEIAIEASIPVVSLYTFSTENWKRPIKEVKFLWKLLEEYFKTQLKRCCELGLCIRISGDISKLPLKSQYSLQEAVKRSANGSKLIANFCINYGAQDEILRACNSIISKRLALYDNCEKSKANSALEIKEFEAALFTNGLPPVDLLIRTGGEMRLSNFLLWQCAYAEMYITDTLWPDFSSDEFNNAIDAFTKRQRRFGGL